MRRKPIEELTGSAKIAAMGEVNLRQASARKARERKAAKGERVPERMCLGCGAFDDDPCFAGCKAVAP